MLKLGACAQLTIKKRSCLLSLASCQSHPIGPSINKSLLQRMLSHLHQNITPLWKHQTQSSKEKFIIIKREEGQVSIEKLRYVFLTTYALSKTKHPNIHITKPMTLWILRQIKFNLIDIQSILNQLPLPKINLLKQP
jgi:hypothetical protein